MYICSMSFEYQYNQLKNQLLKATRGIGFEEIIEAIGAGGLLANINHHNPKKYPNQQELIVRCQRYIYVVPYVREVSGDLFLKTIYPSRKYTKKYIKEVR
jgi:hypothetical protein